jgi:hypothetical protein
MKATDEVRWHCELLVEDMEMALAYTRARQQAMREQVEGQGCGSKGRLSL